MANQDLPPVPLQAAMVDRGGFISQTWAAWFRQLFTRVGGHNAETNLQLAIDIAAVSTVSSTEAQFSITNNQATPADVTGLLFSGATYRSFDALVQVYRYTTGGSGNELAATCRLRGVYKTNAASWEMTVDGVSGDLIDSFGPAGLLFSISSGGQVKYTSHNQAGTASVSKGKFNYTTLRVES